MDDNKLFGITLTPPSPSPIPDTEAEVPGSPQIEPDEWVYVVKSVSDPNTNKAKAMTATMPVSMSHSMAEDSDQVSQLNFFNPMC